ncbi:MAG: hypothetical protein AAFO99_05320 [Bacteroidota bacterium]
MKTKFLFTTFLLLVLQWSNAQEMDPEEMADYATTTMIEQLNLNEEQQEQVTGLNLKYSKKQADLMNRKGSMFSKMGDMKKIKKEKNKELEKILSKEQMEKFEDDVEPMIRDHMRKKMKG